MNFLRGKSTSDNKSLGSLFVEGLKATSGASQTRTVSYNIFNQVVAFKGVRDGVGTSTIVANVAVALAERGAKVCVLDTSILNPSQDVYLDTDYIKDLNLGKHDWFDLPFTEENVFNKSEINSLISVLSFSNRTIVDLLSIQDTPELVLNTLDEVKDKFDVILIDLCSESTNIAATCLQQANIVYQVWSNDRVSLNNLETFITNNVTLSCPMDKMRNVILSELQSVVTDWDTLLKKYRVKKLCSIPKSDDIALECITGDCIWLSSVPSKEIDAYRDSIATICGKILGLDIKDTDGEKVDLKSLDDEEVNLNA